MRDVGVTLLELIAAMAIGAVVTATAAFGFRQLRGEWELSGAVRQVVLDLRMARIGAIAAARTQGLRFEPLAGHYLREWRTEIGDYATDAEPRWLPPGVRVVDCSGQGAAVRFRPRGNSASFGTITLRGRGGATRRIVVDMAGRVRVAR